MKKVGDTQSRRKVVPRSLPERRALRCQPPSIGAGALNRIGFQTFRHARSGVHLPPQTQGEGQTLRHLPFILGKSREVRVQGISGSIDLKECIWAVRLDRRFTKVEVIYNYPARSALKYKRC